MTWFAPFRLDVVNQCLWRGETRVPLMPKPFAVLRYLVEHAGRLVTQDELLDAIWPQTYVQPEILRRYILEIRRVLGDRAEKPRFVETLPKRGYQFIAPVTNGEIADLTDSAATVIKTRLVGRESALADLDAHLRSALRGQRQVVFVVGEAGIGKTSLVDAFQQTSAAAPAVFVARGQSVEGFAGKEAYYPIFEALSQLVRGPAKTLVLNALETYAPTWMVQFPSLVKAEQQASLQQEILGATPERMVRELCQALEVISQSVTLVLILEDLHWADRSTVDLISAIARRREAARLYLLGTVRPADLILSESPLRALKQDLLLHHLSSEIRLERLQESDVADYLAAEFAGDLPQGLAAVIHRHSEGNPLFMIAMLDHLAQQGVLSQASGRWKITVPLERVNPGVPETLRQMLELQLQHLSEEQKDLLKCASVVGQHFTAWGVATMLGSDLSAVEEKCARLEEEHQFLKSSGMRELPNGLETPQYEFRHSLYREVLYRKLNPAQRANLHKCLAEGLETQGAQARPEMAAKIALHFEEGRDFERAIPYLLLVAQNARRRYAHREAISVLEHAHQLVSKVPGERGQKLHLEALEKIGDTYYVQGDIARSIGTYQSMATRAAGAGLLSAEANALLRLAYPASFVDADRCIAGCERAAQIGAATNDPGLEARATLMAACWRLLLDGWREEQAQACAAAIATLERLGSDLPPYDQILYARVLAFQAQYPAALESAERALQKLNPADDVLEHATGLSVKAAALAYMGRLGEAHRIITRRISLAEKNDGKLPGEDDNVAWLSILRATLVWLQFQAFEFKGIRELVASHDPRKPMRLRNAILLGFAHFEDGEYDQALRCFGEVRHQSNHRSLLHWYWRMLAQLGLIETWLVLGDLAKANVEADPLEEDVCACGDAYLKVLTWDTRARLALANGKQDTAEHYIRKGLETIASAQVPLTAWRIHAAAWQVYRATDHAKAGVHRSLARRNIQEIADSLREVESLRQSFLNAREVREILAEEQKAQPKQRGQRVLGTTPA